MAAGKKEKPTVTGSARGRKARANTVAPGTMASRCLAFTPGPVATPSRVNGRTESGTDSGWRNGVAGCTRASGPKALRVDTAVGSRPTPSPSSRGLGPMGCRTATERKPTRTEVSSTPSPLPIFPLSLANVASRTSPKHKSDTTEIYEAECSTGR